MDFKQTAKNVWDKSTENLKENTGFADKAVLEIYDLRKIEQKPITVEPVDVTGNTGGAKKATKINGGSELGQGPGSMTYVDQRVLADIFERAAAEKKDSPLAVAAGQLRKGDKGLLVNGISRKLYTVQFNPNTIQISAHGGGLVKKNDYQKKDTEGGQDSSATDTNSTGLTYDRETTNIILSVSLLFDACKVADAFMMEKFNPSQSLTTMGKSIATSVGQSMGALDENGKKRESAMTFSVQEEVEGFIGMIRNRRTRYLTFRWGDFSYTGVATSLDVQYTMFNIAGQPIRATVNMRIMCYDDGMKGAQVVWAEYYQELFKELTKAKTEAGETMSALQANSKNWLNL